MDDNTGKAEQHARNSVCELSTPSELITKMTATLLVAEGTDVELLNILSEKILTMNPADTAVADAIKAIEVLAVERAEASDNDQPNND